MRSFFVVTVRLVEADSDQGESTLPLDHAKYQRGLLGQDLRSSYNSNARVRDTSAHVSDIYGSSYEQHNTDAISP